MQEQLALLRQRIARIDRKYAAGGPAVSPLPRPGRLTPHHYDIDHYVSGRIVETPYGTHFESDRLWERHRRHGNMQIADLADLPEDLLDVISENTIPRSHPYRWAFLDTETTGLAGGAGTYAFLIGVGSITEQGFRLRQFFMRDFGEEPSLLYGLAQHLAEFDVLVTYNGRTYDQPLLETRYRMQRSRPPFARMEHLDLLFGARRLWKLRFDSCRLVELENQILGIEREGDLPGELIPYVYFEYLKTREAMQVVPILHHNANDILTLACLTGIVPWAFKSPTEVKLAHGAELVGLARWLRRAERFEDAIKLFRRAVDLGLRDALLFRTLWDIAALERKLERLDSALALFTELATCRNEFRCAALLELAKHYEHKEKNLAMALDMTESALALEDTPELRHRQARLRRRLDSPKPRRLL